MTDRELLELAAKAAGIEMIGWSGMQDAFVVIREGEYGRTQHGWNPLTDDGDALRLAVSLRLSIDHGYPPSGPWYVVAERNGCEGCYEPVCCVEDDFDDEQFRFSATRRAIVRAAAEIGRGMK